MGVDSLLLGLESLPLLIGLESLLFGFSVESLLLHVLHLLCGVMLDTLLTLLLLDTLHHITQPEDFDVEHLHFN